MVDPNNDEFKSQPAEDAANESKLKSIAIGALWCTCCFNTDFRRAEEVRVVKWFLNTDKDEDKRRADEPR